MASIATVAAIATAGAAVVGAGAELYQGYQSKVAADQTAQTLSNQGKADFASSQRDALQKQLETKFLLSTEQAQAAASGGGAGTEAPTIVRMMTQTAARGEQANENALYTGEYQRNSYSRASVAAGQSGNLSFLGSVAGGAGRLLSGAGETYKTYADLTR